MAGADDAEAPAASSAAAAAAANPSSAIEEGIQRDVRPWLNLVDDLSNLTHGTEISVPQVRGGGGGRGSGGVGGR